MRAFYIAQNMQSSDALNRARKQVSFTCLANVAAVSDKTRSGVVP